MYHSLRVMALDQLPYCATQKQLRLLLGGVIECHLLVAGVPVYRRLITPVLQPTGEVRPNGVHRSHSQAAFARLARARQ